MNVVRPLFPIRVAAALALGTAACVVQAQVWGTYQGNIGHSGYVPLEVDPPNIAQLWQLPLPGMVNLTQASCGNGMVFVSGQASGTYNSYSLWGIDASTGLIEWTNSWLSDYSLTPPALYGGNVYVQTTSSYYGTGLLSCFATNGDFGWRQPFDVGYGSYLAPTVDNGVAYVAGGGSGGVYAFGAFDGTHDWFCNLLTQSAAWTPSLDATYAYNYAGNYYSGPYASGLYAVNRVTGYADYQIYDANFGAVSTATPAISGSLCFVVNASRLVAFDLKRRILAWQVLRHCTGQPDAIGNAVYAIDGASLAAFDASTGSLLWNWTPLTGSLTGAFVISNNIAFATDGVQTYGIDLTTHQLVWSAPVAGAMSVGDGNLYVADKLGTVTAFSLGALALTPPTAYQVYRGLLLSGGLPSLCNVDDQALVVRPGPVLGAQEAPIQLVVTGTLPNTAPTQLKFHLLASVNSVNVSQSVELWNFATSKWELLGSTAASAAETPDDITAANPAQFVQPGTGQVQARLSWKQVGPTLVYPWHASVDQAVWLEDQR
ncbi:MAG: outer membrane protein assembly factor BamB family protein [Fimbriimonadaceae bacterium]